MVVEKVRGLFEPHMVDMKRRKEVIERSRRPFFLFMAELFMIMVMFIYFSKLSVLILEIMDGVHQDMYILTYIVYLAFLIMMADALVGISSQKPQAWRKAVRSGGITMLIVLYGLVWSKSRTLADAASLDPYVLVVLSVLMLLVMMLPSVRDYFTPTLAEKRPLGAWIAYVFFVPLYPNKKFRLGYDE